MESIEAKKPNIFTNPLVVIFSALLCCALWGSATPFIKLGSEILIPEAQKGVPSTMLFAGVRFALAGIITVVIYSIARRKFLYPRLQNMPRVLTVGAFQTVIQYLLLNII